MGGGVAVAPTPSVVEGAGLGLGHLEGEAGAKEDLGRIGEDVFREGDGAGGGDIGEVEAAGGEDAGLTGDGEGGNAIEAEEGQGDFAVDLEGGGGVAEAEEPGGVVAPAGAGEAVVDGVGLVQRDELEAGEANGGGASAVAGGNLDGAAVGALNAEVEEVEALNEALLGVALAGPRDDVAGGGGPAIDEGHRRNRRRGGRGRSA